MLKIENTEVMGWEHAIRGMRNPKNSWENSISNYCEEIDCDDCDMANFRPQNSGACYKVCVTDYALMERLRNAGTDHRKFMRMIAVYLDITAPLYWWKEFDTYKVGTVANSCSTMHKIHEKEFTLEDFSCEHLFNVRSGEPSPKIGGIECTSTGVLEHVITALNYWREKYLGLSKIDEAAWRAAPKGNGLTDESLTAAKKNCWWQMIQLLPSSYNQKRTVMLNYEVLANIYKSRRNHKLDEWHTFCDWIKTLPYSELITGEENV